MSRNVEDTDQPRLQAQMSKRMSRHVYLGQNCRANPLGSVVQKIDMLSGGGERGRVHLAKTLREGCNLLLLDEPSNDLDVETLRSLEEVLQDFAGSALPGARSSSRTTAGSSTASARTPSPSSRTATASSSSRAASGSTRHGRQSTASSKPAE
eukprot:scaffold66570_cov59-Phaeocystis_antarctica.AAC.3